MKLKTLAAAMLMASAAYAGPHGDYILTTRADNQLDVQSTKYGTWTGFLSTYIVEQGDTHEISLTFYSPDYFTPYNGGHFAVVLRGNVLFPNGDITQLAARGRGVIFGNATAYPDTMPGCGPTQANNVVTFETWWLDNGQKNCVMGWAQSTPLENNQYYNLTVSSTRDNGLYIAYVLKQYVHWVGWVVKSEDMVYDFTPSDNTDGGIAIAQVFSTPGKTIYIWGLTDTWR